MSRQSEGEKWAQRGDQHRKVEYDTRRKRMTDPYVQVEVMDLGTTMRNLAARMPEMTEQERVILTVVVAMVALGLLTSCVPVVDTGPHTTVTPDHHPGISTASPAPTHIEATPSPPAVVTATVTRAPRATETKPPVILACTDSAQTLYGKPDKSQVLGPPESWQQSEKTNIKDADGVPIFNDVSVITQNVRKAGLDVAGVVVLEQGGYVAVLKNSEGELVWPQTEVTKADGTKEWQAAARPDGYGKVNKEHVIVIPPPAFGNMGVRMESVTQDGQTGSCAYVVANNGEGKTVGEWNPVTNKWSMIDAMRPTEIPVTVLSMDYKNPTKLTWEQFVTGKFAGENLKPFSEKTTLGSFSKVGDLKRWWAPELSQNYPDPEERPMRWAGYMIVNKDGHEMLVLREEVKNKDNTVGELFFGYDLPDLHLDLWTSGWKGDAKYYTPVVPVEKDYCQYKPHISMCSNYPDNIGDLIEKFMTEGIVPKELSRVLLVPNGAPWVH